MPLRCIRATIPAPFELHRFVPSFGVVAVIAFFCLLDPTRFAWGNDLFHEVVAPILQQRCLQCHDDGEREGELSLQTAEFTLDNAFIQVGDPDASRLLEVITPSGGTAEMPKDGQPLSAREVEAIRNWIAEGAPWPEGMRLEHATVNDLDWWSFRPLTRPSLPEFSRVDTTLEVEGEDTSTNPEFPHPEFPIRTPIDAMVLGKLREQGLTPSQPADRRVLLRRVTYDLIGLPPTPEEVERFVNDPAADAYEKRVEELLASPHYGERWARHWLDVVKYADTCGYDKDKLRPSAWPYRDYVIRSLNEDKPFARFVQEQIAGDVLFPGNPDGILGLGFIAAGPWDFIGHVEVPESKIDGKVARNLDRDDMVCNVLNTFCSLTVQCARCHHHKFDPITQQQYYGLQSIFAAVDRAERPYDLDPDVEQRRRQLEDQIAASREALKQVEQEIIDAGGERLLQADKRIEELVARLHVQKEPAFGYHSAIAAEPLTEKWVELDLEQSRDLLRIILHPCHDDFGGIGAGFGFPKRFRVDVCDESGHWRTLAEHTSDDFPNPRLDSVVVDSDNGSVRRIRITATKLAERKGDFIFALAEVEAIGEGDENLASGMTVTSLDSIEAPVRWARQNLTDGHWASFDDDDLAKELSSRHRQRDDLIGEIETTDRLERRRSAQSTLNAAQEALQGLPAGKMVYAASTHFAPQGSFKPTGGKPREIFMLHRGEVTQPREPAIPGMLPLGTAVSWQLAPDSPDSERRAAMARWLTDRTHPLVWRSIVNRVWQYHFGQGIVATPNDFGRMGAEPTHPELLDWLAVEFRDGGDWLTPQSLKSLHRLIVTSSVYRQSSQDREAASAIDANNRFLWRMNRRRLEAEEIRDSILSVSGVLDTSMGGPGFQLFELERTEHSPHFEYHKFDPSDPATHRRSIYRFIVRSQPDPWMTTLDCADSSQSTPRRTETLTSLQALSLLNNRFNLVMAERFAERLQREAGADNLEQHVRRAFELTAQRPADSSSVDEMAGYARTHGLPNLCRFLFNLSEFVYLD